MARKQYIVTSREGEEQSTVKSLVGVFEGDIKSFNGVFNEVSGATETIERDLEKRGVPGMEAARQAWLMSRCRVGAIFHYPDVNMYYRILEADFTSDRRPIVPGLRVLDYDRRKATVSLNQFMDDGLMCPGGKYFDHWYYVTPDGEDVPHKRFDGSRMQSIH